MSARQYRLIQPDKYFINQRQGDPWLEVEGKPVELEGYDLFVHHFLDEDIDAWRVSSGVAGMWLGEGHTRQAAISNALYRIWKARTEGKTLDELLDRSINKFGLSPRYEWVKEEP